jgi:hypothetical protein
MIANKIFKCVYMVLLKGEACESFFPNAKELNIAQIKINSTMIDNDIEAFSSMQKTVNAIKSKVGDYKSELVEFNPEFYPSLNTSNLEFEVNVNITPSNHGTEYVTTSASKVFDKQGDYKNLRMTVEYEDGSIAASVVSDPEAYLLIKQEAALQQDRFFTTSEKVLVH